MKNIALIGFMGSGKSTFGKLLSKHYNIKFIDLDKFITKKEKKTIPEIFNNYGEKKFRKLERKYLEKVVKKNNIILACGGGTPCFFNNIYLINKHFNTIYLKKNTEKIIQTLKKKPHKRPLISNLTENELSEFVYEKIKTREKYYLKAKRVFKFDEYILNDLINFIELDES